MITPHIANLVGAGGIALVLAALFAWWCISVPVAMFVAPLLRDSVDVAQEFADELDAADVVRGFELLLRGEV